MWSSDWLPRNTGQLFIELDESQIPYFHPQERTASAYIKFKPIRINSRPI